MTPKNEKDDPLVNLLRTQIQQASDREIEARHERERLEMMLQQALTKSGRAYRNPAEAIKAFLAEQSTAQTEDEIVQGVISRGGVVFAGEPSTRIKQAIGRCVFLKTIRQTEDGRFSLPG
jgi:hypothetical protein